MLFRSVSIHSSHIELFRQASSPLPARFAIGGLTRQASVLAGLVWETFGAPATFLVGAALCLLALAVIAMRPAARPAQ